MKIKVNNALDFCVGAGVHNVILPPPAPSTPTPTPSVEIPTTMLWPPGFGVNQNKFSNGGSPVKHRGLWVVLDGHDCGTLILDLTIPPQPNIAYPTIWPFSARKPVFAASTVKMNGTSVACAQTLGFPPIPLMSCGDPVSTPSSWSMINAANTLQVGMTLGDFVAGIVTIVVSVATDYAFSLIPFPSGFLGTALSNSLKGLAPVAILSSFITSGLTGNPSFKGSIGLPFLGVQVSYTPNPDGSDPHWVAQYNVGPATWDSKADTPVQWFGTPAPPSVVPAPASPAAGLAAQATSPPTGAGPGNGS